MCSILSTKRGFLLGIPSIFTFLTGLGVQVFTLQAANEQRVKDFRCLAPNLFQERSMTISKSHRDPSVFAILLATAFFVCSSFDGGQSGSSTSAAFDQSGAVVILPADGGAPIPPPPPPPQHFRSAAKPA
jgi:hypothetical protein